MAVAATPLLQDDEVEEVVPVSSWAKQGLAPMVPHSASPTDLIQYGPLTAQGNFLSHMDNNYSDLHPLVTAAVTSGYSHGPFFHDDATALQAVPFDAIPNDRPTALDPWVEMNRVYDESSYALYTQNAPIDSTIYAASSASQTYYSTNPTAPLADFMSTASTERQMLGPWEGIWAFNPNNVAENYVYPSTADQSETQVAPSLPSQPSGTIDVATSTASAVAPLGPSLNDQMSPDSGISPSRLSHPLPSDLEQSLSSYRRLSGSTEEASTTRKTDPRNASKALRPEKTKRNKTMQVQLVVPRRQGPLSVEQRQKADDMRYYGACWRCRRYKKPCNGPGECDTCKTSGFRVWPSTIGCYRGNMEEFISGVMPGNAEVIMKDLHTFSKQPNWKVHFGYKPDMDPLPLLVGFEDRFTKLSLKLEATRMAGRGFLELLDILANFQRSRTKPDTCLEHACEALSYICDIYHAFVITDTEVALQPKELLTALTKFRSHYSANWRHFLALCLSGRRNAWFPAFLCATINVPLLVVLKDGFVAIPEPTRSSLWPNISFLIEDLRNRLYPMGLDLLSALAKGIKPWKLRCWGMVPCVDASTKKQIPGQFERDPDGLRLLGGDIGAFDGFSAVQAWLDRNREAMYYGVSFLTTTPFCERNAKMQPIAALAWIFEVAPPGQKVVNGRLVEDLDDSSKDCH